MEDHYRILQLSVDASFDEIKASYRKLVLLYHPDKNQSFSANNDEVEQKFLQIQNAWKLLSNDETRKEYDIQLHQERMSKINAEEIGLNEFMMGEDGVRSRPCRCGEMYEVCIIIV